MQSRAGRSVKNCGNNEGFILLGEIGGFHGLTEITYPDVRSYVKKHKQTYILGADPATAEYFASCSRTDKVPNPQYQLFIDAGVFDLQIWFRRALMDQWPQIERLARNFTRIRGEGGTFIRDRRDRKLRDTGAETAEERRRD